MEITTEHTAEIDAPIRLVAMAVHEDICGCEHGYLRHGRTYMETAHVVVNALRDNGWRVTPPEVAAPSPCEHGRRYCPECHTDDFL